MIESQVDYLMELLAYRRANGLTEIAPRAEAQRRYIAEIDERTKGSVWTAGGCVSWYLDATGRNSTLWPGSVRAYQRRLARLHPSDYDVEIARPRIPIAEPVAAVA